MMAGNPNNWWSMHSNLRSSSSASDHHHHHHHQQHEEVVPTSLFISQTHPSSSLLPPLQFLHGGSSSASSSSSASASSLLPFLSSADPHAQDFPHSWSQLLLGGLPSEHEHHHHHHHHQERYSSNEFEATRVINGGVQVDVKQEVSSQSNNNNNNNDNNNNNLQLYGSQFHEEQEQEQEQVSLGVSNNRSAAAAAWTHQMMPASLSSPKSCITSLSSSTATNTNNNNNTSSSNMLDFSTNKRSTLQAESHQHADNTTNSECNSTATTGGVPPKKPRVQSSSTPPLKVRKEKLGDRITALHQLVSPFGKTDTASVLLEAIGYIRFLQGQIEALSSPYLGNNNASAKNNPHSVHGERNCLFPDHPGQLLNDSCLKRRRAANQEENKEGTKDLKSRGLCLVPISCTQLVGSDNGADYWAQSLGGGF